MFAKVILVVSAQVLFIQHALSICAGRPNMGAGACGLSTPIAASCAGPALAAPTCSGQGYYGYGNAGLGHGNAGLGYGSGLAIEVIPTSGGSLPIYSTSSISPTGLSVVSDNVFEGTLYVNGELPFASAVSLEGVVPSGGAGGVSYSCGNGITAIEIAPAAAVGPAYGAGVGAYGAGLGAYGAGLGAHGAAAIAPLSLLPEAGCGALGAEIVAPIDGCYTPDIYY